MAPTPSPPLVGPAHVQTAEYLQTSTEIATPPSTYAPYLTYAYAKTDHELLVHEAGINVIHYLSPLMPASTESQSYPLLTGSYSTSAATTCNGQAVTTYSGTRPLANTLSAYSNGSYVVNNASAYLSAAFSAWQNYVTYATGSASVPDAWFVDNATDYGTSATPCGDSSQSAWATGIANSLTNAATIHPVFLNALGVWTMNWAQAQQNVLNSPNVVGAEFEGCYGGHGYNSAITGDYVDGTDKKWLEAEYGEINTIAKHKTFWCYNQNTGDGASLIANRVYMYASFLLSYDEQYAVYQMADATPSTFKVFPETGFVPTEPTLTAGDVSGYQQSTGVYERQFAACYYRGTLIGNCAVVVNPSPTYMFAIPTGTYRHAAVLSGDGVLDGGSMSFGAAAPVSLGPTSAAILLP